MRTRTDRFRSNVTGIAMLAALLISPITEILAAEARPAEQCTRATNDSMDELFRSWNLALATLDPKRVAALYWPDAVLLPTVSNVPRTDAAAIEEYFSHFLQKHPRGAIVKRTIFHGCSMSVDAGLYDFAMMDPAGITTTVSARYTFVYTYKDGVWKIQHHHSSALPEGSSSAMPPHASPTAPVVAQAIDQPSMKPAGSVSVIAGVPDPVIRLGKATRTPQSYLGRGQRVQPEHETVGIKVCASSADKPRTFELTDPAPQGEVNDAALKWAGASRWDVSGTPAEDRPICAQVIVRFSATQP
jgi:uncharacterized protein (TIGR02246 family)